MIGVAIVCYNTPKIITRAVRSVEPFVDKVLIIDYSDNETKQECEGLINEKIQVVHIPQNIGHGFGLNAAISILNTDYVIVMDSDAELIDGTLIKEMKSMLKSKVYGVGRVIKYANGKYLSPYFAMFRRKTFYDFPAFIHSGAPWEKTMDAIKGKKELREPVNFLNRVIHEGRQTREIAGNWRSTFGGRDGI